MQKPEQMNFALSRLVSYSLTARSESTAWLEGLASCINRAAVAMEDPDRAEVEGDHLVIRRAQKQSSSAA